MTDGTLGFQWLGSYFRDSFEGPGSNIGQICVGLSDLQINFENGWSIQPMMGTILHYSKDDKLLGSYEVDTKPWDITFFELIYIGVESFDVPHPDLLVMLFENGDRLEFINDGSPESFVFGGPSEPGSSGLYVICPGY